MKRKKSKTEQGTIFILRKDIGLGGGPENGNFPLLHVMKMSLRRRMGGTKKPQNTLKKRWSLTLISTTYESKKNAHLWDNLGASFIRLNELGRVSNYLD